MGIRFGLIGCGAMGGMIASAFDGGGIGGALVAVYDVDVGKASTLVKRLRDKPAISSSASDLINSVDFVIEAASQEAVEEYAEETVKAGKNIMIMSVGALLDEELMGRLISAAKKSGVGIYLPSGAVAGVDALLSASAAGIDEITLTSTKPPAGLKGVKYLTDRGINLDLLTSPTAVYEGPASEAVKLFPKNINVAAVASLASGKDIKVRIVADPKAKTNMHEIHVRGIFGELTTKTSNVPTPNNPKTSYLAALSAVATLKKITGVVRIGN